MKYNHLYHGDCFEIMPTFPAGSIDLIIADPTYEMKNKRPTGGGFYIPQYMRHFNEIQERQGLLASDIPRFLDEAKRLMKVFNLYVFTNIEYVEYYLAFARQHQFIRTLFSWYKNNCCPNHHNHFLIDQEFCVHMRKPGAYFNSSLGYEKYHTVFQYPIGGGSRKTSHPCEKPLQFVKNLIEISSPPGVVVLDPFGGSGTTGEAARDLGRSWIVIERDPGYFEMAEKRLEIALGEEAS